ncbi:MAG: guanylate kinase [Deltaproteobacteria bacterium GWA2_38_16]|nr:MAG: guanylate kinase [Deltaproteobacteria bacterium GWA2_38_16]OGQ03185.1 MAG: guanylate kinase [Deltaproteobacteria bacterium RIFCSPHIGHO2_02_FULL_38_15]OGQ33888.1 MAG: guanylate kinase [Deltaproteobacteria bacterium RIFCSPLOWO2_01_FULL_38_9]OGQ62534.1 MAG: guanylate kinase [Deltaproteobacteria bacterium RIFCSPLOWO2_12_FULL_38_8]HBQ20391.1 guanylate kinase [Deltaproteobacteria bacterium]
MSNSQKPGNLIIISAPSGAGKTTLCRAVLSRMKNIIPSISYTTRPSRSNEKNGVDYYFISENLFKGMIEKNEFSEWALVHGYYYGTQKSFLEENIQNGRDVIFNIDVQGAKNLKKQYPEAVTIFIHTPSFEELKKRLIGRKSETEKSIQKRLADAEAELKSSSAYEFHVVNDDVEKAVSQLISIIESKRKK